MTPSLRRAVARARAYSVEELCRAEKVATRTRQWALAEEIRWAIAHRAIHGDGGDERECALPE